MLVMIWFGLVCVGLRRRGCCFLFVRLPAFVSCFVCFLVQSSALFNCSLFFVFHNHSLVFVFYIL